MGRAARRLYPSRGFNSRARADEGDGPDPGGLLSGKSRTGLALRGVALGAGGPVIIAQGE
jgi:hypothetical protein